MDVTRHFACMMLALVCLGCPATAQEQFRLGDDDLWTRIGTPEPGSAEEQLSVARRALASGQASRAATIAGDWIERHPDHPLLPEAHLVRGDALAASDDVYEALFDYEAIARGHAGSEAFVRAIEREVAIAERFLRGEKRRLGGIKFVDATDDGEELLIRAQERLPGSRLAERAAITLADHYLAERRMDLAAEMYDILLRNFPRSEYRDKAQRRIVYAHLAAFRGPEFDAGGLVNARTRLQEIKATMPALAQTMSADALLTRIDGSDAEKRLRTAEWYLRTGDDVAAELTLRRLIRAHPEQVATGRAIGLLRSLIPRLPGAIVDEVPEYRALGLIVEEVSP